MTDLPRFAPAAAAVTFVGAGPGAALHLTLGAYRALQDADVVVHDRLVGPQILALIPPHVTRIDVGKEGFGPSALQSDIHAILVAQALTGGTRGAPERRGLWAFSVVWTKKSRRWNRRACPFAILPGLTAASVAAASVGQSLTKRGRNKSLRI